MVEQTFRSPGFFEREIDLAARRQATSGIPGGVVGTAAKGPAFVPVTVGDFTDFINRFGDLHPDLPAVYAAFEFLKSKRALTFMRVLGAGGNNTPADRDNTRTAGIVKGAGFKVHGAITTTSLNVKRTSTGGGTAAVTRATVHGGAYFITANHSLDDSGSSLDALTTYPILNDNPSVQANRGVETQLLRGVVYTTSGYRLTAVGAAESYAYSTYDPPVGTAKIAVATGNAVHECAIKQHFLLEDSDGTKVRFFISDTNDSGVGDAVAGLQLNRDGAGATQALNSGTNYTLAADNIAGELHYALGVVFTGGSAVKKDGILTALVSSINAIAALDITAVAVDIDDAADASGFTLKQGTPGSAGNTTIASSLHATFLIRNLADDTNVAAFTDGADDALANTLQSDGRATITSSEFNLVIAKSDHTVLRTIKASLDPEHPSYISKVLNTDPHKFKSTNHLLYLDLPVENELAPAIEVFVASPSDAAISDSPFSSDYAKAWSTMGRMDTRYTTAHTPAIISQPFGTQEFDIMTFESLSDGAAGNSEVKISIANIKASLDEANPHGTFEVQVRKAKDLDSDPEILESYPGCTLDSNSENFVARLIGDYNTFYNFDADDDEERRLIVRGKYPNRSLYIRVKMSDVYERGELPEEALPFGFRGIPVLKTSESLTDSAKVTITQDGAPVGKVLTDAQLISGATDAEKTRVNTKLSADQTAAVLKRISSPIFPPFPMRFKITRGKMKSTIGGSAPSGDPEITEKVDPKLYWGMKPERLPRTASVDSAVLNPNAGGIFNELITGYTKFQGMLQTGALLSGSSIDLSNANKFTLAKVALNAAGSVTNIAEHVTGSAREHMLEAVYLRDATVDGSNYTVEDPGYGTRITLATLLSSSSVKFNRFAAYSKFSLPLFGGFDGLNILDKDMHLMNDRSSSTDAPSSFFGKASTEFDAAFTAETGLNEGKPGIGARNSMVMTYNQAVLIMTDAMTVRHNILAVPGIRDSFVTDYAAERVKAYSLALYLMDIPAYSQDMTRLFGTEDRQAVATLASTSPDIRETAEQFSSRVVDNNFSATYFPDVVIADTTNSTQVTVPASVAAMKALAFSDSVSFPWFAPAGFNRGALDNVTNVDTRLTAGDRDELYDARINPIANFPNAGFVIFGQKTLQLAKSALDRVNVRRMLLEVKRLISRIAERLLFEPNNIETRARFINLVTPLLATVQAQAGIDSFQVVMDDTNNTAEDVESNRLNGRIVVVPTRAIEFIAIDFIVTNSGVSFE